MAGFLAARGYALLFAIDALTCLIFAAIVVLGIDRTRRPARTARIGGRRGYGVVLRDRLMVVFVLLMLAQETV